MGRGGGGNASVGFILLMCLSVQGKDMTPEEEEQLSMGLNALHDDGAVHASDLEKMFKYLEKKEAPSLAGLSGQNFIEAMSVITVCVLHFYPFRNSVSLCIFPNYVPYHHPLSSPPYPSPPFSWPTSQGMHLILMSNRVTSRTR